MADSAVTARARAVFPVGVRRWLKLLGLGVGFGLLAGASLFIHLVPGLLRGVPPWIGAALLFSVGALIQVVTRDLRVGIAASLIALVVAIAVTAVSYSAPLMLPGYTEGAVSLLLTVFLGRTAAAIFIVLPLTFYGGYFAALVVDAYLFQ